MSHFSNHIFVESSGKWMHKAALVSSIVGKKYVSAKSPKNRFYVNTNKDISDSYENISEDIIVKTGKFIVGWKERQVLLLENYDNKKNILLSAVWLCTKKNKYHLILKEMVLDEKSNTLNHKLDKYVKITNDEIELMFNSSSVVHEILKN